MPVVYRLEDNNGVGPYNSDNYDKMDLFNKHNILNKSRPALKPHHLSEAIVTRIYTYDEEVKAACPSLRKLRTWFNDGLFEHIINNGFLLRRYNVKVFYRVGLQGIFFDDDIISVKTIKARNARDIHNI